MSVSSRYTTEPSREPLSTTRVSSSTPWSASEPRQLGSRAASSSWERPPQRIRHASRCGSLARRRRGSVPPAPPMAIQNATASPSPADRLVALKASPPVIQVEDLHKSFRIPTHRVDSLKERIVRPFSRPRLPRAPCPRRGLLRDQAGGVLRHRRPQRLRQEHAAEAARQHLPRRRRKDPHGRAGWRRSSSSASASTRS